MPKHLTLDQAVSAFDRASDTVWLNEAIRVTFHKAYEFELWHEVHGEALEREAGCEEIEESVLA